MSEPADYEESDVEMRQADPISKEEEDNLLAEDDEDRMEDARSHCAPSTITLSPTRSTRSDASYRTNTSYLSRAYWTIRAARHASRTVKRLPTATLGVDTGLKYTSDSTGSLRNESDGRSRRAFHVHSYNTSMNISCSFDTGSMMCVTCATRYSHPVLYRDNEERDSTDTPAGCFILSDQNFPAMIASTGCGGCIKIIRIEEGSPDELARFFLETVKGFTIAAGSVCLIGSASYLNWVGVAEYIDNFIKAKRRIHNCYGSGIIVAHGISVFGPDCTKEPTKLGSMLDNVVSWLKSGAGEKRDIYASRDLALQHGFSVGSPSASTNVRAVPPATRPPPGSPSASGGHSNQLTRNSGLGSPSASGSAIVASISSTGTGSPSASVQVSAGTGPPSASVPASVGTGSPSASVAHASSTPSALPSFFNRGTGGSPSAPPRGQTICTTHNIRLPDGPTSSEKSIYECKIWDSYIHHATENEELQICKLLVEELNEKFCLDLDECITVDRSCCEDDSASTDGGDSRATRFIVVGASHAERLCKAFTENNQSTTYISTKLWKMQEEDTDEICAEIATAVATPWEGETVLIYHVLDNHVFFSSSSPGEKTKP